MRVRLKPGRNPMVIDNKLTPVHPEYFVVPASAVDAMLLELQEGNVEYAPPDSRGSIEDARRDLQLRIVEIAPVPHVEPPPAPPRVPPRSSGHPVRKPAKKD
jgi:hypothetical protein